MYELSFVYVEARLRIGLFGIEIGRLINIHSLNKHRQRNLAGADIQRGPTLSVLKELKGSNGGISK